MSMFLSMRVPGRFLRNTFACLLAVLPLGCATMGDDSGGTLQVLGSVLSGVGQGMGGQDGGQLQALGGALAGDDAAAQRGLEQYQQAVAEEARQRAAQEAAAAQQQRAMQEAAAARSQAQQEAMARQREDSGAPQSSPPTRHYENLSDCLSVSNENGLSPTMVNRCNRKVMFTYCTIGQVNDYFNCGPGHYQASVGADVYGRGADEVGPGRRVAFSASQKNRVVWFACEYPGLPFLTSYSPPAGACR